MQVKSVAGVAALVRQRLDEMRAEVFSRPPSDWVAFQRLQGRHDALSELLGEVSQPINSEDDK